MKVSRKISEGYKVNKSGTFTSTIRHNGKHYSLGTYGTIEMAKDAYQNAIKIIKNGVDVELKLQAISKKKPQQKAIYYDKSKDKFIVNIRIGEFKDLSDAEKAKDNAFKLLNS